MVSAHILDSLTPNSYLLLIGTFAIFLAHFEDILVFNSLAYCCYHLIVFTINTFRVFDSLSQAFEKCIKRLLGEQPDEAGNQAARGGSLRRLRNEAAGPIPQRRPGIIYRANHCINN